MADLIALKQANAARWAVANITRLHEFEPVAKRLLAGKDRYRSVEAKTGVPWWFIAVVHEREASANFALSLAQGDPWNRRSVHVPSGRGPFTSWDDAAVDALVRCAPFAASNKDWSVGGALTMLERYNGLGYAARGRPSPYIWAGTDQYVSGKYVSDGVYDPNAVDKQLGCAGLLKALTLIDTTISFGSRQAVTPLRPLDNQMPPLKPAYPAPPSIPNPSKGSIGAWIASLFAAIFKRKV